MLDQGPQLMGNALSGLNLGFWLGWECTDKKIMGRRFSADGVAARRGMMKCAAVTRAGDPCQNLPIRGFTMCRHHRRGEERIAQEHSLELRYLRNIEVGSTAMIEARSRSALASLTRRRFHRNWRLDPTIDAVTIEFSTQADFDRVVKWLRDNCGVDILSEAPQPFPGHTRPLTPRAIDRCKWAAWRLLRSEKNASEQFEAAAKRRVRCALYDDVRFWRLVDRIDAGNPPRPRRTKAEMAAGVPKGASRRALPASGRQNVDSEQDVLEEIFAKIRGV